MMKHLFCILLSLLLLLAAMSFSLAEDAASTETEAPAESADPVLLVTVNGDEIYTDNTYLNNVIDYYLQYAQSYGYDTSDPDLITVINQYSLDYAIRDVLIGQKAEEYGLNNFTDEDKAPLEKAARDEWAQIVDSFVEGAGEITDTSTDEEKAAARADAEANILANYGYTEAIYVESYMQSALDNLCSERLADYLTNGRTITDEEIQTYFNDLVNDDKETYEDVGTYEFYTNYYGQSSYYIPEGYRSIVHILLPVDEELMNTWKDLSARLEEQKSEAEAEPTETEAPAEDAEPAAEPEPTAEPVTQEMVDAAEKAILESVQSTVDEIKAKLESGTSFDDLIKEYGTDSGMQDDATRAEGYAVHADSILWDSAFKNAAMALEKVGDVSEPVLSQFGVHILQYLKDIPGGAVELTEEMKQEFHDTLLNEMRNEALNTALDEWINTSDIVYTETGEAWKLPEEEAEEAEDGAAAAE